MIETLISNKTRIKLLLKFFLNSRNKAYLRGLESEFGESTNAIRLELNRLEDAGMLTSALQGNKKIFQANTQHPLFSEINSLLLKHIGLDSIVTNVVKRLGDVDSVYLTGTFAKGLDSQIIDLIFVGKIDQEYLIKLVGKAESLIKRKIRYIIYEELDENNIHWEQFDTEPLLIWARNLD